MYDNPISEETA